MDIGSKKVISLYLGNDKVISLDKGYKRIYQVSSPSPLPTDYVRIGNLLWSTKNYINADIEVPIREDEPIGEFFNGMTVLEKMGGLLRGTGWRIPSLADAEDLSLGLEAIAGSSSASSISEVARSTSGWTSGNGTNLSGFNALPLGMRTYGVTTGGTKFSETFVGKYAYFWTSEPVYYEIEQYPYPRWLKTIEFSKGVAGILNFTIYKRYINYAPEKSAFHKCNIRLCRDA